MKLRQLSLTLSAALLSALLAACGSAPEAERERITDSSVKRQQQTLNEAVQSPAPVHSTQQDQAEMAAQAPTRLSLTRQAYSKGKMAALPPLHRPTAGVDRERYGELAENGIHSVVDRPVSTFSVDVDSGAYALVRRFLNQGRMPPSDLVRAEELINYFNYHYPYPDSAEHPFSLTTEVGPTPWNMATCLVHIGIQGIATAADLRPAANLVFLVDVSGSMSDQNKLPLLKSAFKLLLQQLTAEDRVSLVVYAGASGVVLEPTAGDQRGKIVSALAQLEAGGSTHGSAGIQLAYEMAEQARIEGGINRVILATDGDFNVGTVDHRRLVEMIEQQRQRGISLTTLGFGQGNYNDHLMEQLADRGNGNYAYIDNINEARKVLVEELSATLETIAKDVKIEVEWNPALVAEYRLIGYENRLLAAEDFNNDKVDAGDIGAGHTVTALYEIALHESDGQRLSPRRYHSTTAKSHEKGDELAFLRLRYKQPDQHRSQLITQPILLSNQEPLAATSEAYRFSAAVAGFAQLLRGGRYTEAFDFDDAVALANTARGEDRFGYRGEFVRLVSLAGSLATPLTLNK
ncbi:MAG: VWA domain-containing protein [Candidatus Thiodiazotropha sp. (ex. Lucinisca nassula)]|nr:VWA domain-containing protein [Candidatus Thiodiazotropha sp. (ex. Lucinisca nassula)]MBW9270781.1 VWA domain-containing protein [Candidatus Thiodiazotropha sp. (ex. Lucinisca nassula)]